LISTTVSFFLVANLAKIYINATHAFVVESPGKAGASYDLVAKTWKATPILENFTPSSMIATPAGLFMWGEIANAEEVFVPTVFLYDPAGDDWEVLTLDDTPKARTGAVSVVIGADVYIIGGKESVSVGGAHSRAVNIFNTTSKTWRSGPELPIPPGADGEKIGRGDRIGTAKKDAILLSEDKYLYTFNIPNSTWSFVEPGTLRDNASLFWHGEKIYALSPYPSGYRVLGESSVTGKPDWDSLPKSPELNARDDSCSVNYGKYVVSWGGNLSQALIGGSWGRQESFADGWALDLDTKRWVFLPAPAESLRRGAASCQRVGDEVLIWGGVHEEKGSSFKSDKTPYNDMLIINVSGLNTAATPSKKVDFGSVSRGDPIDCAIGEARVVGSLASQSIDLRMYDEGHETFSGISVYSKAGHAFGVKTDGWWGRENASGWGYVEYNGHSFANCILEQPASVMWSPGEKQYQFTIKNLRKGGDTATSCASEVDSGTLQGCLHIAPREDD
jgi:hypothetical protein